MSWYSKPYLIFFLYMAPTLFAVIAVFYFMLPRHKKVSQNYNFRESSIHQCFVM